MKYNTINAFQHFRQFTKTIKATNFWAANLQFGKLHNTIAVLDNNNAEHGQFSKYKLQLIRNISELSSKCVNYWKIILKNHCVFK